MLKFLAITGGVAVVAIAVVVSNREPSVDGRSLSEWLRLGVHSQFTRDNTDVTNAVRKIGVKAIPILLDKLRAEDPAWKETLTSGWRRRFFPEQWVHGTAWGYMEANWGFSILGTQAVSAIPSLSAMMIEQGRGGFQLGCIGTQALPVLKAALTNDNAKIRINALFGAMARSDVARAAAKEIVGLRHDTNEIVSMFALSATSALPKDQQLAVLKAFLADPRPSIQVRALVSIEYRGLDSTNAIPLIVPFLTNIDFMVRRTASNALLSVAPATAAEYGISSNEFDMPRDAVRTGRNEFQ
jgi:HEAT repeat protein